MRILAVFLLSVASVLADGEPFLRDGECLRFDGKVDSFMGISFGYMPPAKDQTLTFDYSAQPEGSLEFGSKVGEVSNYIPFPRSFSITNLSRFGNKNKTLSSVRLVAESKSHKVTINFSRAGGDGHDRMWILIENRGDILGVWRLIGVLNTEVEQDVAPKNDECLDDS